MSFLAGIADVPAQDPGLWYFLSLEPVVRELKRQKRVPRTHFPTTNKPMTPKAKAKRVVERQAWMWSINL